jgi:hypothetical protein
MPLPERFYTTKTRSCHSTVDFAVVHSSGFLSTVW